VEDHKAVIATMRSAQELCDKLDDVGTASKLEEVIDGAERRCWFLFEMSRTADKSGH
jgi:starvation-inducible DNA-binding protein